MFEFTSTAISINEIIIRLVLIIIIGSILGTQRESKPGPAGIRTHILIGLGSCLITMAAIILPTMYPDSIQDGAKIIAAIISGIGFLGAGAIMKQGNNTRGLTTAVTIWVIAAIGITIGAGIYALSLIVTALVIIDLVIIKKLKHFLKASSICLTVKVGFKTSNIDLKSFLESLHKEDFEILSKRIHDNEDALSLEFIIKTDSKKDIIDIKDTISGYGDIKSISLSETIDF